MKKLLVVAMLTMLVVNTFADEKKKKVSEVTYKVEMDCQSCVNKITKNIPFEKGVKDLNVDMEGQTVTVKYREDKTTKENLVKAFEKLDFKAEELKEGECSSQKKKCCSGCKN
ncbi:heavy-metal-associated domain-containing protein [Carboxylicivirga marina]|uniref:Cation transporter n=1 Tax=Carboxylicivirga marina TaxID=2800988 RepID=A0ABS1HID1_9BACT|nr:heavy-metal-associated domain-containing protein [Carboxylicivirga marina]MBK3517413.1 cation transporter [Carboxylicivirga marina]